MGSAANPLGRSIDIVEGFPAVDLSTGANTGDWVSLENCDGVLIVFRSGVGTAGDDPTLTILQASDNAGTGSKALNPTTTHVFKKQAATSQAAVNEWSDASGDVTDNAVTNATSAEQSATWTVWIPATALDVANGFTHVSATVADVGCNAQPGDLLYIISNPRYAVDPTDDTRPSYIA